MGWTSASAQATTDETPPVTCGLNLSAGAKAVADACTEDLASWPADDIEYRGFMLTSRGNALSVMGQPQRALADLDAAIALRPDYPEAWAARGQHRFVAGDYVHAIADFDRAIILDPDLVAAYAGRADAKLRSGDPQGAVEDAKTALKLHGGAVQAYGTLAMVSLRGGDPKLALEQVNTGLELSPENFRLLWIRASIYAALDQPEDLLADVEAMLKQRPADAAALLMRASSRMRSGELDKALVDLDAVIKAAPDNVQAHGMRAILLAYKGEAAGAMAETEVLVRLDPAIGQLIKAQVLVQLKREPEAMAAYEASIAAKPTAEAYFSRANLWEDKDRERQIADLTQALALDPGFSQARGARALAYARAKRQDEAIADAALTLKTSPDQLDALHAQVIVFDELNDDARLIATLDRLIPLSEPHQSLFNLRCWSLATSGGDLVKALADCKEAVRLAPKVGGYWDSLAMVHLQAGRWDEAIADYDTALKLNPKIATSWYGRGVARLRKGQAAEGQADLTAARAINAKVDAEFARYRLIP